MDDTGCAGRNRSERSTEHERSWSMERNAVAVEQHSQQRQSMHRSEKSRRQLRNPLIVAFPELTFSAAAQARLDGRTSDVRYKLRSKATLPSLLTPARLD